jgi:SAM-dependent methyltransferase
MAGHASLQPSPWVRRWAHLLQPGGAVLDVACGSGRHVRWLAARGHRVTALDRDAQALSALADVAELCVADIEGAPWPLPGRQFDAVLVTNYLWRPLWPQLLAALRPGAVLLYETFADGNQHLGKPSRADFLLRHGELLDMARSLHIVAYEDGYLDTPPRQVQRIAAMVTPPGAEGVRYPLDAGG